MSMMAGVLVFPGAQMVKTLPAMPETQVRSLGWEDPLEKGKATPSSILAWRIPWTVQIMRWQKVTHGRVTFTSITYYLLSNDDNI